MGPTDRLVARRARCGAVRGSHRPGRGTRTRSRPRAAAHRIARASSLTLVSEPLGWLAQSPGSRRAVRDLRAPQLRPVEPLLDPARAAAAPHPRAVATAVERRLLTLEPYRSLGFDVDEILSAQIVWALDDIVYATEAEYGPKRGTDMLFRAGIEGVRADPGSYLGGVGLGMAGFLLLPVQRGLRRNARPAAADAEQRRGDRGAGERPSDSRRRRRRVLGYGRRRWSKSWGLEATGRYRIVGGLSSGRRRDLAVARATTARVD